MSLLSIAIDPPDLSGVVNAIENLRDAGALTTTNGDLMKTLDPTIDDPSGQITHIGHLYAKLPLHYRVSRMLFLAHIFGFLEEGLIMAASMSVRSPFMRSFKPSLESYKEKIEYTNGSSSDSLASLFLIYEWKYERERNQWDIRDERKWASKKQVHLKTLQEIDMLVQQLAKRLQEAGLKISDALVQGTGDEPINLDQADFPESDNKRWYSNMSNNRYYKNSSLSGGSAQQKREPLRKRLSRDDILMLQCILFGAFYPNYLQSYYDDPNNFFFAVNNAESLEYDPARTVEVRQFVSPFPPSPIVPFSHSPLSFSSLPFPLFCPIPLLASHSIKSPPPFITTVRMNSIPSSTSFSPALFHTCATSLLYKHRLMIFLLHPNLSVPSC